MNKLQASLMAALCSLILFSGFAHGDASVEKGYVIEASFKTKLPKEYVWQVLTDYNNIDKFVPFIKESRVEPDGVLYQKVKGHFWFFSKTVELRLKLDVDRYNSIRFESVDDKSFRIYRGAWTLEDGDTVSISYTLLAKPNFFIPRAVLRSVLKRNTDRYVEEVQAEITRRYESEQEMIRNIIENTDSLDNTFGGSK